MLEVCSSELIADMYKELSESAVRMLISVIYNSKTLGITCPTERLVKKL